MSTDIPDLPKRLPEKFRQIREHLGLSPDEIALKIGTTGEEITAIESDKLDMPITMMWRYLKLAGCPLSNLFRDDLEVTFRELKLVSTSSGQMGKPS